MNNKKYNSTEEAFESWRRYVTSFGIGIRPDIDLPSALEVRCRQKIITTNIMAKDIGKVCTIISLAIGQGEFGITPLQLPTRLLL